RAPSGVSARQSNRLLPHRRHPAHLPWLRLVCLPPATSLRLIVMTRVRLVVAYDGTDFHGFAVNPNVRTVAGELSAAIVRMVRHHVEVMCAGRTDAGVHAWSQVVAFDTATDVDVDRLRRALIGQLAPEIV